MKHIFKPKYKICFQTRSKVWIHKNSRLRYFYRIRHKIVSKKGRFFKRYLITKNMKWTVARRKMVPYLKKMDRARFNYKNLFFTKQQLKNFYGDLKEYEMRNIFKRSWNVSKNFRCNTFLGALEQRSSMVLFRMRFLPTIFACHQYIKHKGILVNEKIINHPNYCIGIGDIMTIPNDQWYIFYEFLYERLVNRAFGEGITFTRKMYLFRKIVKLRSKNKVMFIKNFKLLKIFNKLKLKFLCFKKHLFKVFKLLFNQKKKLQENFFLNEINILKINLKLKCLKILNKSLYLNIFFPLKKIRYKFKNLWFLKFWSNPFYISKINKIVVLLYKIKNLIVNFNWIFWNLLKSWVVLDTYLIPEFFQLKIFNKNSKNFLDIFKTEESLDTHCFYEEMVLNNRNIHSCLNKSLKQFLQLRFKKTKFLRIPAIKYRRYLKYKLHNLRYKHKKKRIFKEWCRTPHFYIPNYFEVDFNTLRTCFLEYPEITEVFYGFRKSFKQIISFYKERAL